MSGTILITLHVLSQLILVSYEVYHCSLNITDGETEAQRGRFTILSIPHHFSLVHQRSPCKVVTSTRGVTSSHFHGGFCLLRLFCMFVCLFWKEWNSVQLWVISNTSKKFRLRNDTSSTFTKPFKFIEYFIFLSWFCTKMFPQSWPGEFGSHCPSLHSQLSMKLFKQH